MWARLVFGKQDRDCHLELDRLEEDEEGRAGVVLHVVVQTKRLQAKYQWREC